MKQSGIRRLLAAVVCALAAGICYSCGGGSAGSGGTVMELEAESESAADGPGLERTDGAAAPESGGPSEVRAPGLVEADGSGTLAVAPAETTAIPAESAADPVLIYVHVCGEVAAPGVYALPEGSRVYEAIEAAGGTTEAGAGDYLNLAGTLDDGMRIEVPDRAQAKRWEAKGRTWEGAFAGSGQGASSQGKIGLIGSGEAAGGAAKVNLNTAGREELMTLKGIGQSRAEDIIRYREQYGGFRSVEDVMNVPGIKAGAFEKIKDSITV